MQELKPMRLGRFQFSVRFVLAAIAAIALAIATMIAEARRRHEYWDRLYYHLQQLEGSAPPLAQGFWEQLSQEDQARCIRAWLYHSAMAEKYKTALTFPLFFVSPDP
jgi:hypothetical protein